MVNELSLVGMDQQLLLWFNGHHNLFFDGFMSYFTGKLVWVPMYVCIFFVMLRNYHWRTVLACVVGVTLTITFADQVCSSLIRPLVERPRPCSEASPIVDMVHIVNGRRGGSYGFPSCHAANTFGLAFFLMYLMKQRMLNVWMFFWAAMNCYTRMYLGLHYPGDIVVGAVIGFACATVFFLLTKFLAREHLGAVRFSSLIVGVGIITTAFIILFSAIPIEGHLG